MAKELSTYKPVYLIFGDQDLLLERALEQLKRNVGEVADLDFNSETFDGENASADEIVSACNTLPFASERRLVVVRNVDKMAKDGTDALVAYAENPSETTIPMTAISRSGLAITNSSTEPSRSSPRLAAA